MSVQTTTRRALVAGAAILPAIMVPAMAIARGDDHDPDVALDRLWRQRTVSAAEDRALSAAFKEAEAKLPAWAKPGPDHVRSDGTECGHVVGWPRDDRIVPDDRHWRHEILVRRSPESIRADFERRAAFRPDERSEARAAYREQMRELIRLCRRQHDERAKVCLDAIDAADDANYEARADIEDSIRALPPTLNGIAAMLLIEIDYGCKVDARLAWPDGPLAMAAAALRRLRPQLSGIIAEHVGELLDGDPDRSVHDCAFCTAFG